MCELFAMSSSEPTEMTYSMQEFARHGGISGPHTDGWGLAYYQQGDLRLIKEPEAAAHSACIRFLRDTPFRARLVLSHIRRLTQGERALRNSQPFARELGGRMHCFAHNGSLHAAGLDGLERPEPSFRPLGETDSERTFCLLLERLRPLYRAAHAPPLSTRLAVLAELAPRLRELGPANFIYSDGEYLFAHGDRRTQSDGEIRPPGLHMLHRHCAAHAAAQPITGLAVQPAPVAQEVILVASVPLSKEPGWRALQAGEVLAVRNGSIVAGRETA